MKSKIWIVEAYFDNWDSTYWRVVGVFTSKSSANQHKYKWKKFFESNSNFFDKPDYYNDEDEDWTGSDEYFRLISKYGDMKYFKEITIRSIPIDKDVLIHNSKQSNTDDMINLMSQWDRDYKIKQII